MIKLVQFQILTELMYAVTKIEICHMFPHNLDQEDRENEKGIMQQNKQYGKGIILWLSEDCDIL